MSLRLFNQHYFADGERPVFLVGGGGYGANTDRIANNRTDLDGYLGHYRALGLNYTRVFAIDPWSSRHFADALFPWARVREAGTGADGLPRFDLERWDEAWWNRLRYFLERAQTLGMYVELCVFDRCGLGRLDPYSQLPERWHRHPFMPENHVNRLDLPGADGSGDPAFYDLGNRRLLAYQERYVDRLLAETAPFGTVLYQLCNEYQGRWDWIGHWARHCRRWAAAHGRTVLVGHDDYHTDNEGDPFACPDLDFVDVHGGKHKLPQTSADYHAACVRLWGRGKVLTMDECNWWLVRNGTLAPDATVHAAAREFWATALGGAAAVQHKEREECAGPDCPRGYGDPVHGHRFDDRLERRLGHLCRFMNEGDAPSAWAGMAPHDAWVRQLPAGVAGASCLAGPPGALLYLWRDPAGTAVAGPLVLSLQEGPAAVRVRCFDPERGQWLESAPAAAGADGLLRITPPHFTHDLALRVVSAVPEHLNT